METYMSQNLCPKAKINAINSYRNQSTHELGLKLGTETGTGLELLVLGSAETGRQRTLRLTACLIYFFSPRGQG